MAFLGILIILIITISIAESYISDLSVIPSGTTRPARIDEANQHRDGQGERMKNWCAARNVGIINLTTNDHLPVNCKRDQKHGGV